jgi:hypothetical protein
VDLQFASVNPQLLRDVLEAGHQRVVALLSRGVPVLERERIVALDRDGAVQRRNFFASILRD